MAEARTPRARANRQGPAARPVPAPPASAPPPQAPPLQLPAETPPVLPAPETLIARLLTIMLALAVATAVAGGVWFLIKYGHQPTAYATLAPPDPMLTDPLRIVKQAWAGEPAALVQSAALLLLLTPLARELMALYIMGRRREWAYVVIAIVVCFILTWGLVARS